MSGGKGSSRRPAAISQQEMAERWLATFASSDDETRGTAAGHQESATSLVSSGSHPALPVTPGGK